jgi:hypothetical protein
VSSVKEGTLVGCELGTDVDGAVEGLGVLRVLIVEGALVVGKLLDG